MAARASALPAAASSAMASQRRGDRERRCRGGLLPRPARAARTAGVGRPSAPKWPWTSIRSDALVGVGRSNGCSGRPNRRAALPARMARLSASTMRAVSTTLSAAWTGRAGAPEPNRTRLGADVADDGFERTEMRQATGFEEQVRPACRARPGNRRAACSAHRRARRGRRLRWLLPIARGVAEALHREQQRHADRSAHGSGTLRSRRSRPGCRERTARRRRPRLARAPAPLASRGIGPDSAWQRGSSDAVGCRRGPRRSPRSWRGVAHARPGRGRSPCCVQRGAARRWMAVAAMRSAARTVDVDHGRRSRAAAAGRAHRADRRR